MRSDYGGADSPRRAGAPTVTGVSVQCPPARAARSANVVESRIAIVASRTAIQVSWRLQPSSTGHGSGPCRVAHAIGASGPWMRRTTRPRVISSGGWLSRYPPVGPRSDRTMPAARSWGRSCSRTVTGRLDGGGKLLELVQVGVVGERQRQDGSGGVIGAAVMIVILVIGVLVDELLFGTVEQAIRRRYGLIDEAATT